MPLRKVNVHDHRIWSSRQNSRLKCLRLAEGFDLVAKAGQLYGKPLERQQLIITNINQPPAAFFVNNRRQGKNSALVASTAIFQ